MNPPLSSDGHRRSKSGPTVAQTWRVTFRHRNDARPLLDSPPLARLPYCYFSPRSRTGRRLTGYLKRTMAGRGWDGEDAPPIEAIVSRFAELGYVDDRTLAE